MSKVAKQTRLAMESPFVSKTEAYGTANMILTGKKTISRDEALKMFGEASDELDRQFTRMDHNMKALAQGEIEVAAAARDLIGRSKNLAAQVGDAMARIDKIVVKDFEQKLLQLERFVAAITVLDELKRSGRLDAVVNAFQRTSHP